MTFGKRPQFERNLEGKMVLQLWLELGNLNRVKNKISSMGIYSPRTGKAYTNGAIILSSWRWCIWNPEESYEIVKKFRESKGEKLTMQEWYVELTQHAKTSLSLNGYTKFLQGAGLENRTKSN